MNYQKIMCAVDIDYTGAVAVPSLEAIERASSLAKSGGAELTFVHSLDISEISRKELVDWEAGPYKKRRHQVEAVLESLCERASGATTKLLFGTPWLALIREVLRSGYDLVVLGAARPTSFTKALFGGTSIKLVRKCPCPVWVSKAGEQHAGGVLVAHCLTPVGSQALTWGAAEAAASNSQLRVVHALKPLRGMFESSQSPAEIAAECERRRAQIEAEIRELPETPPSVKVVVEGGAPAPLIYKTLQDEPTDLLVMGTVARSGVAGLITGNTAETLLPWVDCSLLALKPEGFETPVEFEE